MLINTLSVLAAVLIVFVTIVAVQPSDFRVARTASIAAPAPTLFALVDDYRNWTAWSPYEKLDPAMKKSYEGAASGTGAIYTWAGNSKAGEGRATITESRPGELIRIKLEFLKPFAATNTAEFRFAPDGDRTAVAWSLTGTRNFMFRAVGLFMDMDKVVGGQFEEGLAQLESAAEKAPAR